MFETLTDRLQDVFRNLGRRGKLRPEDVDAALREIRLALLEADVHFSVVKALLERVRERALSEQVSRALNPAQQVIRIIHEELIRVLGDPAPLQLSGPAPRVVLLVGLQGSGKTTTIAKLARRLRGEGERVLLVAADTYRPAAAEQLSILGEEIGLPVFHQEGLGPVSLVESAVQQAARSGVTVVLVDTAGRSQLDDMLMSELQSMRDRVQPVEVLLVADAMTGQEAVNIATGFHEALALTGLILTKMDGDARGGAAISMRTVTGVPIKFLGLGEARTELDVFEPDRLASRILGMGDIKGLVEKAESVMDEEAAEVQVERLIKGEFTLEDFSRQLQQVRKMGPLGKLLELLPGGLAAMSAQVDDVVAERQLVRTQAILQSMTVHERRKPEVLNASRKRRIASGSGTSVQEINQLLRQYREMRRMFKQLGKRGLGGMTLPGLRR